MSSALDDVGRGSDPLLLHLREMTEVVAQQNATITALRIEHATVLAERDAARGRRPCLSAVTAGRRLR
jgi:hypothetical protein